MPAWIMIGSDSHHVTPQCPVRCLRAVLRDNAFNALACGLSTRLEHAIQVADVLDLHSQSRLSEIPGLGPRRIAAIERGLFIAGLIEPPQPVSRRARKRPSPCPHLTTSTPASRTDGQPSRQRSPAPPARSLPSPANAPTRSGSAKPPSPPARQLLADTAEAVGPDTPAPDLLSCLARYRARLATLVAAGSAQPARDPATTTTHHPATPWPGCPAQHGRGTDLRRAVFTFAAEDGQAGPDGQHQVTEIWAFFRQPGEEHDDDILETGCLDVPAGSPIANLARRVAVSPGMARKVEGILRASVAACPCQHQPVPSHLSDADAECPALTTLRLLEAIEHATR